jgi:hypothetical protein
MRPSSLLPRLAEAVVLNFVKIVDCHVMIPLIDRASRRDFNGGVVENLVIFRHDGPFLALQLFSLHVEGRPNEAMHQLHSIELVIALQ